MILVDTSVWIDHLRTHSAHLADLLNSGQILAHPFVTGEIALGRVRQRDLVLRTLLGLPQADVATDEEVRHFIDRHALFGSGVGYVDVHLLASIRLTPTAALWTRDKRLHAVADRLGLAMA